MVGAIYLYPPKQESDGCQDRQTSGRSSEKNGDNSVTIDLGGSHSTVTIAGQNLNGASTNVEAGKVPPPINSFDREFNFWTPVQRD